MSKAKLRLNEAQKIYKSFSALWVDPKQFLKITTAEKIAHLGSIIEVVGMNDLFNAKHVTT